MAKYATSTFEVHDALGRALVAATADECAELLSGVPRQFDVFREAMPHALRGEWPAVTVLVSRWHSLVDDIVKSAAEEFPQLVQWTNNGFGIVTPRTRCVGSRSSTSITSSVMCRSHRSSLDSVETSVLALLPSTPSGCSCRDAGSSTLGRLQGGPNSRKISIPVVSAGLSILRSGRCSRHSSG